MLAAVGRWWGSVIIVKVFLVLAHSLHFCVNETTKEVYATIPGPTWMVQSDAVCGDLAVMGSNPIKSANILS